MAISPLPETTVRTLVSGQVLITPDRIIKELIDNALDAGATTIAIELDATTVGDLQVKDNGSGVRDVDRDAMCVRHTTSKINRFEDLTDNVVQTLGFRGEALASLVEVASKVTVTTRTATDLVAEKWTVGSNGCRIDCQNVSAGAGTSVQAINLFAGLPVRRKLFEKAAKKSIAAVRAMLITTALLHRDLRLVFRLTRSASSSVVYLGGKTVADAIASTLGRDVLLETEIGVVEFDDGWGIEFAVPKLTANWKVPSRRDFKHVLYAVDGRPLSTVLPTVKKLAKVMKDKMRTTNRGLVFCNIKTPRDRVCYDVNVEPGKDDVIF
ncbi:histidine kinase-like ATPase, partial [Lipomyces japonicus]|uniref:histidine kinase-like ATPase n=1 Tax=Lipomyces japonicus TaxID=56871 RepID=UPI0034CDBF1B